MLSFLVSRSHSPLTTYVLPLAPLHPRKPLYRHLKRRGKDPSRYKQQPFPPRDSANLYKYKTDRHNYSHYAYLPQLKPYIKSEQLGNDTFIFPHHAPQIVGKAHTMYQPEDERGSIPEIHSFYIKLFYKKILNGGKQDSNRDKKFDPVRMDEYFVVNA